MSDNIMPSASRSNHFPDMSDNMMPSASRSMQHSLTYQGNNCSSMMTAWHAWSHSLDHRIPKL
jgi:hypothetical protein